MIKTKEFGELKLISCINMRKLGGYEKLRNLFKSHNINYEIYSLSSKPGRFGGGKVFEASNNKIIISSYSHAITPRIKKVGVYVHYLYILSKQDFEKIKDNLPSRQCK
ncbi:MAG: hypothetical protein JHC31_10720 [Sulfurihydrogenibium sp.]|nr:hypothetical protein [Sulfurihydrogenibium sp.]